ncbi:hypothetical protein E4U43_004680 [Claviceps pusilla]|uniref:Uncharacterized protein n=1 Tax=Claviceps pusilla TaxID=123648 RepID=A0A9P7T2T8_9HYPO|nr:hypothetical protein E4U43_004680 [Claviceps pusilla]
MSQKRVRAEPDNETGCWTRIFDHTARPPFPIPAFRFRYPRAAIIKLRQANVMHLANTCITSDEGLFDGLFSCSKAQTIQTSVAELRILTPTSARNKLFDLFKHNAKSFQDSRT